MKSENRATRAQLDSARPPKPGVRIGGSYRDRARVFIGAIGLMMTLSSVAWAGMLSSESRAHPEDIALGGSRNPGTAGDAAPRAAGADGLRSIVKLDDFEDRAWPDPNLWRALDERAPTWWPSSCRARTGSRALWAFGGRIGEIEQPCGAGAPLGTLSGIVLQLDLRDAAAASQLELYFDLWLQMPPGEDAGFFIFLRVPDGSDVGRVPIFGVTGAGGEWVYPSRRLDLMNLADIADPRQVYDLRGQSWELEWVAHAPNGTAPGAGIFVDDLYLVWEPDAAVPAPTRRPSATPAPATRMPPSATPSPGTHTPSPEPTTSPSPSLTPVSFGEIYLPRVAYELPASETPTAEASPGPTETPDPAAPTATVGLSTQAPILPSSTPSPEPSATATPGL